MTNGIRVLVGCEFTGNVRRKFRELGFDAWSCDLLPAEDGGHHLHCDVMSILDKGWHAAIFFPDCTYLCSSGLHWNKRRPERAEKTEQALEFVQRLMDAPIPHIALENPVGCISTRIRKFDQAIQPYQFGDDASKKTCLWLKNFPLLKETKFVPPRIVKGRERWANQTDSGQNRLGPSPTRGLDRARTYSGIARAMAVQWGAFLRKQYDPS